MASPDGYSWQNGEVVTATKLNEGALPPLGPENQQVMFGQDATHSLVLKWNYNATAANAFALITTFGQNNDLYLQAKNFYFDTASLAFAVQMFSAGRVRVGGGADDALNALQTTSFSATRYSAVPTTLTYGATTNIDFTANDTQTLTLAGAVTFTTSNLANGRTKTIRIVGDGSTRAFTFPAGWTFVSGSAPASLAASKTAFLSLVAFGTADTDVVAGYSAQS